MFKKDGGQEVKGSTQLTLSTIWHQIVNKYNFPGNNIGESKRLDWLYMAMKGGNQLPRIIGLFEGQRKGKLGKVTDHNTGEQVDNTLTCCLGVNCAECEHLKALEADEFMKPGINEGYIDFIQAWSCIAHIITEKGRSSAIDDSMGLILTMDDFLFWDKVHENI